MSWGDESWLAVTDAFYSAAVDGAGWYGALAGLANATGSRVGELIGLGSQRSVPFNWVTDLGPDWTEEFLAVGGADPAVNPFVRVGTRIPVLKSMASGEFIGREERRTNPFLADHARRHDILHICLTPLLKEGGMLVGLAVIRSARQGEIAARQRRIFEAIAPHARAAVRMQMALEHQGSLLMAGALEALSLAVFVCDRLGAVKAMTPAAEGLVSAGRTLRIKNGRLAATRLAETRALADAVATAAGGLLRPGPSPARSVHIHRPAASPLVLEVVPLPRREYAFGFEPRALVIAREAQSDFTRTGEILQVAYGLTAAEAEVAVHLARGHSPEAAAAARGTAVSTVRSQMRSIYAKLEVHRQSELISRINRLR